MEGGAKFSEKEIQNICRDCARGLHYCNQLITNCTQTVHHNCIVHRDIKPQNILMDENGSVQLGSQSIIFQLGDLGSAIKLGKYEEDMMRKTVGTYHFLAPECCDCKQPHIGNSQVRVLLRKDC